MMYATMMVTFPSGSNSVAVQLDDIKRIAPLGTSGAELILYDGGCCYVSEPVKDAADRMVAAYRAQMEAYQQRAAASATVNL